jgi:hypothetical protein
MKDRNGNSRINLLGMPLVLLPPQKFAGHHVSVVVNNELIIGGVTTGIMFKVS